LNILFEYLVDNLAHFYLVYFSTFDFDVVRTRRKLMREASTLNWPVRPSRVVARKRLERHSASSVSRHAVYGNNYWTIVYRI